MGKVAFWNPKIVDKEIMHNAMVRLKKGAEVVAKKARLKCPEGSISRPMYKTGRYAGQAWTARDAGALKRSIRVVEKHGDEGARKRNIRIYAGTKRVFYAQLVEYYTPFLRKALNTSKSKIRSILLNG